MLVLLYRSEFWKDLTESTGCSVIVRDYPFINSCQDPKGGHRQDGTEDRRESEDWEYTFHRRHREFEDDEEKN